MLRVLVYAAVAVGCLSVAQAQEAKTYQCQKNNDTRSVAVSSSKDGCRVLYKKDAKSAGRELWHYRAHPEMCQTQAAQFVKKLESMGMVCGAAS